MVTFEAEFDGTLVLDAVAEDFLVSVEFIQHLGHSHPITDGIHGLKGAQGCGGGLAVRSPGLVRRLGIVKIYLCETDDLKEATELVCKKYEQPAVNNVDKRLKIAKECFVQLASNEGIPIDADILESEEYCHSGSCEVTVKVLSSGDKGRDVFLLQCGLTDMGFTCGVPDGDFGPLTMCAVNELRTELGLLPNGIADQDVWQALVA